jgi:hypothetical protein
LAVYVAGNRSQSDSVALASHAELPEAPRSM